MIDDIKQIIEEVRGVPEFARSLSDDASLTHDAGLSSLELVSFMLLVEQRLHVRIDFELMEFSVLQSLRSFAGFLSRMERLDTEPR